MIDEKYQHRGYGREALRLKTGLGATDMVKGKKRLAPSVENAPSLRLQNPVFSMLFEFCNRLFITIVKEK